jgi:radical SAM protein with 4Fe4S-binding SPASM domain
MSDYEKACKRFDLNGKYDVLLNTDNMKFAFLKKEPREFSTKGKINKYLDDNGFFDTKGIPLSKQMETINFLITEKCNLDCVYCQVQGNYRVNHGYEMDSNAIDKIFSAIEKLDNFDELTINITGGEPLINVDGLRRIISETREKSKNARITLFTNAILASDEVCELIKENGLFVIVSFDGVEAIHNKTRIYKDGSGSYKDVLRGYARLHAYGIPLGVSMVATKDNINFLNSNEFIEFIHDLSPTSIGIEYEHFTDPRSKDDLLDIDSYTSMLISVFRKISSMGIYLENVNRILQGIMNERSRGKECSALGKGITVSAKGFIGPCKSLLVSEMNIDKLKDVSSMYVEQFPDWHARSTFTLRDCEKCDYRWLCGGGCAYDAYKLYGDIKRIDERICYLTKAVIKFYFMELIAKNEPISDIFIPDLNQKRLVYSKDYEKELYRSVGH